MASEPPFQSHDENDGLISLTHVANQHHEDVLVIAASGNIFSDVETRGTAVTDSPESETDSMRETETGKLAIQSTISRLGLDAVPCGGFLS